MAPLFNEEEALLQFHAKLSAVMRGLGEPWGVIYVDDGSTNHGPDLLEA